jgi:L-threonylcarbamoyladenylate synthase
MKGKYLLNSEIKKAAEILKSGGIIIYPTDTVFGVGCLYNQKPAVERIYKLKKRKQSLPMPMLIGSLEQLGKMEVQLNVTAKWLIDKYWPGQLTIILKNSSGQNVGFRMPNYPALIELINFVNVPIIGTSANFHGHQPVKNSKDLDKNFIKQVDYILPGESLLGVESTVVDCTVSPFKIIRQGAIDLFSLSIDTSQVNYVKVKLQKGQKIITSTSKKNKPNSQVLLPLIEDILKKNKIKFLDLCAIYVNQGPGSFTGLRVGIAVANSLSFYLKLPVNGKVPGTIIEPLYT